ncbi:PREDICTED: guanine nucleotide-binding protein G(I)/G(S)/G(O) subunit gamma-7-like isoform X2 [Branchiostoma belcheri]|uniref:Guanine nucleotide-binding protein subunit gamma n=1 Tax=Branchiostoma belcheri TaxID=7741 RepID=A0A6P4Y8B9_BRABE|nr:PREDICTED: guanine nucleotide-binding protein G(I)/G(S)/G(O) subunit gamma-7-like isoform X2 [Branchiostoma belcheri]
MQQCLPSAMRCYTNPEFQDIPPPWGSKNSKMSNSIAQAHKTVDQLRFEAQIERIRVSKAAADLQAYCEQHARDDPLLVGVPASENPFKEKKSCIVL